MLNWKLKTVTQGAAEHAKQLRLMREAFRSVNPQGALWLNGSFWPMADICYYESSDWYHMRDADWRFMAVPFFVSKINLPPGTAFSPMRWARRFKVNDQERKVYHEPVYPNYLLALGFTPQLGYLTFEDLHRRLPIVRAAKEVRNSVMVNANIDPAWWQQVEPAAVEAYALRKGDFGLIPVINRAKEDRVFEISVDTAPLRILPSKPLYLWVAGLELPAEDISVRPERCLTTRIIKRLEQAPARVTFAVDAPQRQPGHIMGAGPVQLAIAASVPAWVYEAEGERFQVPLPEQRGIKVSPAPARPGELQMRVWCERRGTKIFVPEAFLLGKAQPKIELDYRPCETEKATWDDEAGVLIEVPEGMHIIKLVENVRER